MEHGQSAINEATRTSNENSKKRKREGSADSNHHNEKLKHIEPSSTASSSSSIVSNAPTTSTSNTLESANNLLIDGMYWTKVECLSESANSRALSLYDLVRKIRPLASLHFNFCIDSKWVLSQYPRSVRHTPITFVCGTSDAARLRSQSANFPNVTIYGAQLPFAYGTHHTKLSLYETENAIHCVVMTANLVEEDWALKTQAFFHCRAPFGLESGNSSTAPEPSSSRKATPGTTQFSQDLVDYLQSAYLPHPPAVPNKSDLLSSTIQYWIDRICECGGNFNVRNVRLVASVPGRFIKNDLDRFGHLKLRRLLQQHFTSDELLRQSTKIAQFSSIGSLGSKPENWLCDEFLSSMSGTNSMLKSSKSLKLVYPCLSDVKNSLEGYEAGHSLPYQSKTHDKQQYISRYMHKWKSDALERTHAMPHVKSYTGIELNNSATSSAVDNSQAGTENSKPAWVLFTSANLSKSAWGVLEKNNTQLFIRSYELGVLIFRRDDNDDASDLALPFDFPLVPYGKYDLPFQLDIHYPSWLNMK